MKEEIPEWEIRFNPCLKSNIECTNALSEDMKSCQICELNHFRDFEEKKRWLELKKNIKEQIAKAVIEYDNKVFPAGMETTTETERNARQPFYERRKEALKKYTKE